MKFLEGKQLEIQEKILPMMCLDVVGKTFEDSREDLLKVMDSLLVSEYWRSEAC